MLLCILISKSHTQSPVTPAVWSRVFRSSVSQQTPSCSPGMYTSTPRFLMARESSPCTGSMVRNNLRNNTIVNLETMNDFNRMFGVHWFNIYLKLGCGVIWGVFPSMTPRSLMVRVPPGSSRAFRRSSTEALQCGIHLRYVNMMWWALSVFTRELGGCILVLVSQHDIP